MGAEQTAAQTASAAPTAGPAQDDIALLVETGLVDPATARAGKAQRPPSLPLTGVPSKARGLLEARGLGARLAAAAAAAKMGAVGALYRAYPRDPRRLASWSALAGRLLGDPPDLRR